MAHTSDGRRRTAVGGGGRADDSTGPLRNGIEIEPEPVDAEVVDDDIEELSEDPGEAAARLLERALQLGGRGDSEWLHSSAVKSHMRRMDSSFSEKALGFRSFSDFLKSHSDIAVLEETGHERLVRAKD